MTQPTLMAQLVELQEENARLREDAERYRWLRNKALCIEQVGSFSPYVIKGQVMMAIDDKELDAAVDAARKEQK